MGYDVNHQAQDGQLYEIPYENDLGNELQKRDFPIFQGRN